MKRAKRILALVLTMLMVVGMAPTQMLDVQAAGMEQEQQISVQSEEESQDLETPEAETATDTETPASEEGTQEVREGTEEVEEETPETTEETTETPQDSTVEEKTPETTEETPQETEENAETTEETPEVQGNTQETTPEAETQESETPETEENAVEPYAVDPQAVTTAVYEQVDSIESGGEYLIVYQTGSYSNRQYYALTVNGNSLSALQVYPSNGEIELTAEENNVLWTINQNNIQINGQTLKAVGSYGGYSASINSNNGSNFVVNNNNRIRADVSDYWDWDSDWRYLSYSNGGWSVSRSSNSNFTFYQKAETADEPFYPDDAVGEENPQYPYQGSVRTTKTAMTDNFFGNGVAQVELGVTGVPMKRGVDIVLVLDVSSSMTQDGSTKLADAKAAAKNFIENYVFAENADGTPSNNRLGLVTFSGYNDWNGYDGTGNDIQYKLKNANAEQEILDTIEGLTTNSGTDYDFAFSGADDVLDDALTTRDRYVVFMTDGAPSKYNNSTVPGTTASTFENRVNNYNLTNAETVKNQGVTVYTIGFDMDSGNSPYGEVWFSATDCQNILKKIATDENHYINASNSQDLNAAFEAIGTNIRKAGTEAVVTDIVGSAYTLQKTPYHYQFDNSGSATTTPVIEVKSYQLDDDGNRTGEPTVLETVTFSNDGNTVTSSENGQLDVDSSGSFDAKYFSYKVTGQGDNKTETFTWNIGDINDTEIVLSYYVYLKGSTEGDRGDGTYPTNESAVLDYTNYLGHDAQKTFERPELPWGAATVTYEFYLVNEQGQPVNSAGTVIPFEERVKVVSPQTERFNWNSTTEIDASIKAIDYVPDGYTLHMEDAAFTAHAVSSGTGGYANATGTVPAGSADSTHYGNNDPQYISTWVAFGVLNKTTLIPDSIVLDYGKKVKIDVMDNDLLQNAVLNSVAKEDALGDNYDFEAGSTTALADGFGSSVEATNGTATVEDGVVVYEPTKYMDSIDRFLYSAQITMGTEDGQTETQYKYQEVSVIPATTVYYEDNFGNTEDEDGTNGIVFSGAWTEVQEGTDGSEYQDNGTVAEDRHPYGNDSSYADNDKLSAGSAHVVYAEDGSATASFTFKGTGFDLVSRTDKDSAVIMVKVTKDGKTVQNKKLDLEYISGTLYQIPVYTAHFDEYGEYTVTITVSAADETANFYLDAIRIYNPIDPEGEDAAEAVEHYRADGEANADVAELRDMLLDAGTYTSGNADGVLYTDGTNNGTAVYEEEGPNNEVYLKPGHSVGFELKVDAGMQTVQLGAKAVNGDVSLTVGSNQQIQRTLTLTTASDMYYDITDTLRLTTNNDGSQEGVVVITNTGDEDTILSLTNIKVTYSGSGRSTFTVGDESVSQITTLAAARAAVLNDGTDGENDTLQPEQPAAPSWQNRWESVTNQIKDTVNYIGQQIKNWFGSWF